ncbi:MAG: aminopeptidase [Lachnospiraceae bacterium]|jgi:leucyl aminopeptidase (aminopeptidase T)|nr:aminopeptidase [Lachnospiraceae bacterium]
MNLIEEILAEKDQYLERFHFAAERVQSIYEETSLEDCSVSVHGIAFADYFHTVASFLLQILDFYHKKSSGELCDYSLDELKKLNMSLYQDVLPEEYENSFANPAFAAEKLGKEFGQVLCTLYTELRSNIVYAFEDRLFYLATTFELFIEVYNIIEQPDSDAEEAKSAIYYYFFDYADITAADSLHDSFDPARNFATDIICNCDLTDLRYLYYFGEYITENELKTAAYLNSLSEQQIHDMAFTFTDGYRRGFELYQIDLSKKKTVNIRFRLGFERMVREVISQFRQMGLEPCIYRAGISISRRNLRGKVGYYGASPNKQYEYDHRMDDAIFFDKAYADRRLQEQKLALESIKNLCSDFAGPAVAETFGEKPFNPIEKKEALQYSQKQQQLKLDYQAENGMLTNQYIPGDQTSFSIIAYPLPEIGANYEKIFEETIRVNTLNQDEYLNIQTKIIDALDSAEFVTVTGRGENHTNLTISLAPLQDISKETRFENCLADVNIPLGEVFTSPKLEGTEGTLHVTKVFLNELEYHNLTLVFQDGIITEYTCSNFDTEAENKKYILENVLFHHETLPMGEFAIGTNTTAYAMGKKYRISHLLPILIAEKTGPHFAIGDTCFSHEEESVTYNPDGKQMIAKENSYSLLRKTDAKKAYFNCHTDITIPYDELGDILVHRADGEIIPIIRQGRFALPGTEALNNALK